MSQIQNYKPKEYDLEKRTLNFAKNIVKLCRSLKYDIINNKFIDQIIRSASSIGANYREANDGLSKKDFINRLRISRKEAKETPFWLELMDSNPTNQLEINILMDECQQIRNILSAIIVKSQTKVL